MTFQSHDLVGTWELISYELIPPGEAARPLWPGVRGRLHYTADGFVSVLVVRMGADELRNSEVIAYSGSFTVQDNRVFHEISVSNLYHYLDKKLARELEFQGDILVLTTDELVKGATHRVSWRKQQSASV